MTVRSPTACGEYLLWILVPEAIALFVLAPLLKTVPALIPFGILFLAGVVFLWWRGVRSDKRSLGTFLVVIALCASATLALYAETIWWLHDSTSIWWLLVSIALFVGLLL